VTVLVRSVSVRMHCLTDGLSSANATKFQYATSVVKPGGVQVVYWKLQGGKLRVPSEWPRAKDTAISASPFSKLEARICLEQGKELTTRTGCSGRVLSEHIEVRLGLASLVNRL
jgi:hypothetical protein